jgi:hypothetical protein
VVEAEETIELVQKKRDGDGRWSLENPHAGEVHFDMEDGAGEPSRWNTSGPYACCAGATDPLCECMFRELGWRDIGDRAYPRRG